MRDNLPLAGAGRRVSPAARLPHVWDDGAAGWDVYYGLVLATTMLIIVIHGPEWGRPRLLACAALLAMIPWYAAAGRPVLRAHHSQIIRGMIYLTGLGALLAAAQSQAGVSSFMLFAVCPQCFMAVPLRWGAATAAALNGTPLVMRLLRAPGSGGPLLLTAGIAVLGATFAVVFGSWVTKIIEQSRERADLIEQLESTRAELAEANREAGVLAERQRLGADIHDTLAQGFTSIVMLIQAADAEIGDDPAQARRHLQLAASTARESLAETRAVVAALTPAHLQAGTLDGALARLADAAGAELEIAARFEITGSSRPLSTGIEVMLLRVCQEALSNVRKHARASSALVGLTYGQGAVRLEVTDDGAGFEPDAVNGGYGLRGMRGRVGEAGGRLTVCSAPGNGTSVTVEVPS
jgi:signal transduction histidine kinase